MKLQPDNFERIEQYIEGKLSGKALLQFEQQMLEDNAFKEEVEWQQSLIKGIEISAEQALKKKLGAIHQKVIDEQPQNPTKPIPVSSKKRYWLYAASLALLLLPCGIYWWTSSQKPTPPSKEEKQEQSIEEDEEKVFAQPIQKPVWATKIDYKKMEGNLVIANHAISVSIFANDMEQTQFTLQDVILKIYAKNTETWANNLLRANVVENSNNQMQLQIGEAYYSIFPTGVKKDLILIKK